MKGSFRDGIRPAGPSRWEVLMSWRNPDGTLGQVSRTVAAPRREAERVRDQLRHRRHDRGPGSSDETFASVLGEWIDLKDRSLSPSTGHHEPALHATPGVAHTLDAARIRMVVALVWLQEQAGRVRLTSQSPPALASSASPSIR